MTPGSDRAVTTAILNQSHGGIYMVGLVQDGINDRSEGVGLLLQGASVKPTALTLRVSPYVWFRMTSLPGDGP
jgi:hypothetical protein